MRPLIRLLRRQLKTESYLYMFSFQKGDCNIVCKINIEIQEVVELFRKQVVFLAFYIKTYPIAVIDHELGDI